MATDVEFAVSRIASVNPATGEVLGELDSAGPTEVRAAVARARAAQPDWNAWGIRNRIRVLRRFQQILLAHKTDIARRITQEAGKPLVEALLTEVLVVLDAARFLIDNAFAILREEKLPHGNLAMKTKSGRILHEPYGVVGIISPWNYPFSIPATEAMAALVAGNAVVLKPSELTPLIALELQALLREAGVPDDSFPGASGRRRDRGGAGGERNRQTGLHGKRRHGPANRADRRRTPASGGAGTGRQGPHAGARRRRCRCRIERRRLGSVRERGPDLPVGRTLLRASEFVSGVSRRLQREGAQTARRQWHGSGHRNRPHDPRAASARGGIAGGGCEAARRPRAGRRRAAARARPNIFCAHSAGRRRSQACA